MSEHEKGSYRGVPDVACHRRASSSQTRAMACTARLADGVCAAAREAGEESQAVLSQPHLSSDQMDVVQLASSLETCSRSDKLSESS